MEKAIDRRRAIENELKELVCNGSSPTEVQLLHTAARLVAEKTPRNQQHLGRQMEAIKHIAEAIKCLSGD